MASVSRFGEATEPQSRWSRPITIGAFTRPVAHELVEREARLRALPVSEPADPRGQPLKRDALARERDPAPERGVLREQAQDLPVRLRDVAGVARERRPPERPLALAEQGADVERDEADDVERVRDAGLHGAGPQVVAVVERHGAARLQREHRLHVGAHRGDRAAAVRLGVFRPQAERVLVREAVRNVAVQLVVRGRLVGEEIRHEPAREEPFEEIHRVREHAERARLSAVPRRERPVDSRVEVVDALVDVARREALVDARPVHLRDERGPAAHRRGQRLRPAHPAEAGRHDEAPGERAVRATTRSRRAASAKVSYVPCRIPCVPM